MSIIVVKPEGTGDWSSDFLTPALFKASRRIWPPIPIEIEEKEQRESTPHKFHFNLSAEQQDGLDELSSGLCISRSQLLRGLLDGVLDAYYHGTLTIE